MRRLSDSETEIWERLEGGESLRSIGRRLGRWPSTVRTHVASPAEWGCVTGGSPTVEGVKRAGDRVVSVPGRLLPTPVGHWDMSRTP